MRTEGERQLDCARSVETGTELAPLLVAGSNRIAVTHVSTGCEPTALW